MKKSVEAKTHRPALRPIDKKAQAVLKSLNKGFVFMEKTKVSTMKGVLVIALMAGAVLTLVTVNQLKLHTSSKAAGESARLYFSNASQTVTVGQAFSVTIMLDTKDTSSVTSNVVVARALVSYDQTKVQLAGAPDLSSSVFMTGNACETQAIAQGAHCYILNTGTPGMVEVVLAKPTPGVSTTAGNLVTLNFLALQTISASTSTISLQFVGTGNYTDSDVILDNQLGTDILARVGTLSLTINAPTCTSFTYNAWGTCQPDNTQSRTVATSLPSGCTGGSPVLTQACTYVPPTCTSFTYNAWSACQPNNTQSRTVATSSPSGCTGGSPVLSQACTYSGTGETCTSFTYNAWGTCQPDNTQSRTVATSLPSGCTGGSPVLTQACTYVPPTCTSFTYNAWSACQPNNTQSRTVATSSPSGCTGGSPVLSQACTYSSTCTGFTYSSWGTCQADSQQYRSVVNSTPLGCTGGLPVLSQGCTLPTTTSTVTSTTTITTSTISSSSHKKKKKKKKSSSSRKVVNSPSTISKGGILVQSGKKFTPNSSVQLYFSNGKGGYYPPKTVRTNASGGFSVGFRVMKAAGSYPWYAVDVATGKRSNTATYKVK